MSESDEIPKFKEFDWAISDDGKIVRLLFKAQTGEQIASQLTLETLGRFITQLIDIGVKTGEMAAPDEIESAAVAPDLIPVSQMGIAQGREPKEVVFSFQTGILRLMLAVDAGIALETLRKLESMSHPTDKPRRV